MFIIVWIAGDRVDHHQEMFILKLCHLAVFAVSVNTIQLNVVLRELNKCVLPTELDY